MATHGVNSSKALKKRRYIENTLYLEVPTNYQDRRLQKIGGINFA